MSNYLFVCNPSAGRGRGTRTIERLRRRLAVSGLRGEIRVTAAGGEAREIARREAETRAAVVAVGGDGTIQEVAGGLAEARLSAPLPHGGEFAALGVIPAGTGNDLIKAVTIPADFEAAFALLEADRRRPLDLGRIRWNVADDEILRERIFVNNIGLGFEGQVGWEAARIRTPLRGMPLYLLALLRVLGRLVNPDLRLAFPDGAGMSGPALLLSVGIGSTSGGGFRLNPDADPFDGLLDLCHIAKMGRWGVLRFLPRALRGTHLSLTRRVTARRATQFDLVSDTPCHGHADGELLGDRLTAARVEILPGLLPLICPAGEET